MPYWSLYVHLVWATKNRKPLLRGAVVSVLERSLRRTCTEHKVVIHALTVMPEHVHMAVSVPPALAVATLVSRLKGSSSHLLKHADEVRLPDFAWQGEYGALSFGERQLPDVVRYIEEQEERHARRSIWAKLERWEPQPASAGFVNVARGLSPAHAEDGKDR